MWLDNPDGVREKIGEMGNRSYSPQDMVHMMRIGDEVIITPQEKSGKYIKKPEFTLPVSTQLRYDNYSNKFVTLGELVEEEGVSYDYKRIIRAISALDHDREQEL